MNDKLQDESDTDLVFDDTLHSNSQHNSHNINLVSKRSIDNEDQNELIDADDEDDDELSAIDHDDDHWLWGSVRRIRRSIDNIFGNKVRKVARKKHRKGLHNKKRIYKAHGKLLKKNRTNIKKHKKRDHLGPQIHNIIATDSFTTRPKRQNEGDDEDDDEDGDFGSGHEAPPSDKDILCK